MLILHAQTMSLNVAPQTGQAPIIAGHRGKAKAQCFHVIVIKIPLTDGKVPDMEHLWVNAIYMLPSCAVNKRLAYIKTSTGQMLRNARSMKRNPTRETPPKRGSELTKLRKVQRTDWGGVSWRPAGPEPINRPGRNLVFVC